MSTDIEDRNPPVCECKCHTTHVHAGNILCCENAVTVYGNCHDGNNGKGFSTVLV